MPEGRDLLEVLAGRPDAARVRSHLVEYGQRNVAAAQAKIRAPRIPNVTVLQADAGDLATYAETARADLVLLAGVLGNISDDDARATISALPQLCAAGATVIWTRTRRAPDLTRRSGAGSPRPATSNVLSTPRTTCFSPSASTSSQASPSI